MSERINQWVDKLWLAPLILFVTVLCAFACTSASLFALADVLGWFIPYLAIANLILMLYVILRHRDQFVILLLISSLSLGMAYFWMLQTA